MITLKAYGCLDWTLAELRNQVTALLKQHHLSPHWISADGTGITPIPHSYRDVDHLHPGACAVGILIGSGSNEGMGISIVFEYPDGSLWRALRLKYLEEPTCWQAAQLLLPALDAMLV